MNKQIEELFAKAGFHSLEVERLCFENRLKKLTKLIICECANVVDNAKDTVNGKTLKEHFGIKD